MKQVNKTILGSYEIYSVFKNNRVDFQIDSLERLMFDMYVKASLGYALAKQHDQLPYLYEFVIPQSTYFDEMANEVRELSFTMLLDESSIIPELSIYRNYGAVNFPVTLRTDGSVYREVQEINHLLFNALVKVVGLVNGERTEIGKTTYTPNAIKVYKGIQKSGTQKALGYDPKDMRIVVVARSLGAQISGDGPDTAYEGFVCHKNDVAMFDESGEIEFFTDPRGSIEVNLNGFFNKLEIL